jgi:hypothetical protein
MERNDTAGFCDRRGLDQTSPPFAAIHENEIELTAQRSREIYIGIHRYMFPMRIAGADVEMAKLNFPIPFGGGSNTFEPRPVVFEREPAIINPVGIQELSEMHGASSGAPFQAVEAGGLSREGQKRIFQEKHF